jgi:hypothetical protein
MRKLLYLLLLFTFGLSGCEKDDICDANTPTTPRLIITFYSSTPPFVQQPVTRLKVIGEDRTEGIIFNKNADEENRYLVSSDSIAIPLRIDSDSVTYSFILNSGSTNAALTNTDELKFNYTRQNVYVSRACGFKTIYKLDTQTPIVRTDSGADGLWIQDIQIQNTNIEFENETHVKIYF